MIEKVRNISKYDGSNCVKKNQIDARLVLSIFRQLLHVSDVSRSICRAGWIVAIQPAKQTAI